MLSATRQVIDTLDELEVSQQTGESPSPAQIRELFRLRDQAKAELAAVAFLDLHTELDPPPAGEDGRELTAAESARALDDYFAQEPPGRDVKPVPSYQPPAGHRLADVAPELAPLKGTPSLDDVADSLDRALASPKPRVVGKPIGRRRKPRTRRRAR